jgi:hypothetical protein
MVGSNQVENESEKTENKNQFLIRISFFALNLMQQKSNSKHSLLLAAWIH